MSGIKMNRKVVMTVTADAVDAVDVKVKLDFFPDIGGVATHHGLKQAVMALMALVNNKFELKQIATSMRRPYQPRLDLFEAGADAGKAVEE